VNSSSAGRVTPTSLGQAAATNILPSFTRKSLAFDWREHQKGRREEGQALARADIIGRIARHRTFHTVALES